MKLRYFHSQSLILIITSRKKAAERSFIMYINNDRLQPDALNEILALRPEGADAPAKEVDNLESRMKGALLWTMYRPRQSAICV